MPNSKQKYMPLLVETIRADNGLFDSLMPHIERMERSRRDLFGIEPDGYLEEVLGDALRLRASSIGEGRWKVRVLYDTEIRDVEAAAYQPKLINTAALVDGRGISYTWKTADRSELDELTRRAEAAGADTALIVSDGRITDFPYANAAFFDGSSWWTPDLPLLPGTRRARLLDDGRISAIPIAPGNLDRFISVSPINAMLELGEIMVDISSIYQEIL